MGSCGVPGAVAAEQHRPETGWAPGGRGCSPRQVEGVVDDLSPIEDRDDLEGATERVSSGRRWRGRGRGRGQGRGVAVDTHRPVCLQLSQDLLPVVIVIVHHVVARHVEVQQNPLVSCGFEQVVLVCGERPESGAAAWPVLLQACVQPGTGWPASLGRCQAKGERGVRRTGLPDHVSTLPLMPPCLPRAPHGWASDSHPEVSIGTASAHSDQLHGLLCLPPLPLLPLLLLSGLETA